MATSTGPDDLAQAPAPARADALEPRRAQMFPTLEEGQIARLAALGRRRAVAQGEILFEPGDRDVPFFVILSGAMEVVHPSCVTEDLITVHEAGGFTGEANMLSGRVSLVRGRMREPGELLELHRDVLRTLVQTDPELSEI